MKNEAIIVEHLTKVYGNVRAVDDIMLTVEVGQVFSLLGHNGAGKTTTVEILEGLRNPTSGIARIFDVDVSNGYHKIRDKVGILPQDFQPFDNLKPHEAIECWAGLFELKMSKDQVLELLERVDLSHRKNVLSKRLSGGEKRKLGIALALVNQPELIFLDEPTTGLDPKARRDLWALIQDLKRKGATVFLTTHYLDEAEMLSDHIAIMNKGKIIAEGSPREIIRKYGGRSVITLVGAGRKGLEELNRQGIEATLSNEDVLVPINDPSEITTCFAKLSEAEVAIQDMYTKRDTLEDVFLSLIGPKAPGVTAQ